MGLIKKFMNQTRKPEGVLGNLMITGMNTGHAALAKWGSDYLRVSDPANVIDLGCGGGRNVKALSERYAEAKMTGLDYSRLSVERARAFNSTLISSGRCEIVQGDVSAIDLPDGSFDLATAFETIYFWPGLEKCFSEVARILGPDGTFMIVNESDGADGPSKQYEKIIDGMKIYTPEEIESALKAAGFDRVTTYHHDKKPWITVIAEKGNADYKYRVEKDSVQETLMIPLIGRKVCSDHFPELFSDPEADRILGMLDYDLGGKLRKMETAPGLFGALEVAQRQYDLGCEVREYLRDHPEAAVVNMGCGLDDTFRKCDNGTCKGYNIDMPDVIEVRNALLPAGEREQNIAHDLNDFAWMDMIDASGGAVFYASGVFYYFRRTDIQKLFAAMAERFPGGALVFDCCNSRGAKMMTKTWIKEAGIKDVKAFFSLEDASEILSWCGNFKDVTSRSYMRGYRDIYNDVSRFHKIMIRFCDKLVKMVIVKITFK